MSSINNSERTSELGIEQKQKPPFLASKKDALCYIRQLPKQRNVSCVLVFPSASPFLVIPANICGQWHLSCPDIHSNLLSTHHWQSCMQRPLVSFPIRQQVLPVDHVTLNGPERDTRIVLFIAVDELAPSFIPRCVQDGKIRPSARHIVCLDVSKE